MQKCSNVLTKIIALVLCILITFVIVDFHFYQRRKAVQAIRKNDETSKFGGGSKTAEQYLSEESSTQLMKIFKNIKLLLFYELELDNDAKMTRGYKEKLSRKVNRKYLRLFRLIRDLQFEFTRKRFKYLTRSLNLYLKNIIVQKMGEDKGHELLFVQKKMIHELGSAFLKALFYHEDFTEDIAIIYVKTRQNLREIHHIMKCFQKRPNDVTLSVRDSPCTAIPRSREQDSTSNYDFSRTDLNHTRLHDRLDAQVTVSPTDTSDQTSNNWTTLANSTRTWRTFNFYATMDSKLGSVEDLYPDYFLSKRPITSMDQIPTMPEDVILNLQENPDRDGYTRKGVLKKLRDKYVSMNDEELDYAVKAFRGNKSDSEFQKDYEEHMQIVLNSLEGAIRANNLNLTLLEATKKTQKKKVRTGTPPMSRAPNATRRFFNGSRPANFTRWTTRKKNTPLVRTKFIKVKKNKTKKDPSLRLRRDVTTKLAVVKSRDLTKFPVTMQQPETKFIYAKKFDKLLPERRITPDELTNSFESSRKKSTAWNIPFFQRIRTTGVYKELDTEEIGRQQRHRFIIARQYDSVTYYDWNNFVANETGKSKYERGSENYGSYLETTTLSESDYLKVHSMPKDFWPSPFDFNEQKFHEFMYESFYDMVGFTTAPVWFNSTKKTKHPKKLLKVTSPKHKPTTSSIPANTTINFVKLLIKQKLKEYAASRRRTTVTQGTFPYYVFNESYITKFNDLFHHFEYAKAGKDLVNNTNVELHNNFENIQSYMKDLGGHLGEIEDAMKKDIKISLDPHDARVKQTTGFIRYVDKSTRKFSEKFQISTPSSKEFYEKTYNPFIQEFVDFARHMKKYEEEMTEPKAKAQFMEIINKGRTGKNRFTSSEVMQMLKENKDLEDIVQETNKTEGVKIEEIQNEDQERPLKEVEKNDTEHIVEKHSTGGNFKHDGQNSNKGKDKVKTKAREGKKNEGVKKKRKIEDDFAEESVYRDEDSGEVRNNVRKQNLRFEAQQRDATQDSVPIPSEEMEELRKEWVRPYEEFEGNITHRKLNRYQCVECDSNMTYWLSKNFTEYVEHYRVHHFDLYNRSKYMEDVAWKLGYHNPYQCEHCEFYEPFDDDVCFDHYEKDHPEHNRHDTFNHVFRMRRYYLDLRKQWPNNNSAELKEHVCDLFGTPRYAGGTTECTICHFHHPTPRDPVFYSQFYVLPTTEAEEDNYDEILGNRSDVLPSNETRVRVPKWFLRDCDKYRGAPMPSGELLKNLSRGIFDSRSGENDTSEFKSDYYPSCDYRSKTLETGEDMFGSSCEDRM